MKPEDLINLISRQGPYKSTLNSHLQQVLTSEPFLGAARKVLASAQTIQFQLSQTLPKPDMVINIAQQQGYWQGIYFAFEELARLTEFKEEPADGDKS